MTKSVDDPDLISPAVRNAILTSREEKPGPVHLEIAEDIAALPVHKEAGWIFPCPTRSPIGRGRRPLVEPKAIDHAVALIHSAKRPLICIAAGANRKRTQNAMKVHSKGPCSTLLSLWTPLSLNVECVLGRFRTTPSLPVCRSLVSVCSVGSFLLVFTQAPCRNLFALWGICWFV